MNIGTSGDGRRPAGSTPAAHPEGGPPIDGEVGAPARGAGGGSDHDAGGGSNHGAGEGVAHVLPLRFLAGVFGALVVLTWITVAATWVDLGSLNLWLALTIATAKATLVALFFMHLRWDRPINAIIFLGTLLFVLLFVGMALTDVSSYQPELIPGYAPGMPK